MKIVITKSWQLATILGVLLINSTVTAHQQVVVIPLGGKKCTSPAENTFTNSIGMAFNLIPAGTFTMGSPSGIDLVHPAEPGRDSDENQHKVTLTKPFYMQITEATNRQWNTIIFDTGLGTRPSTSHTGDNYPVESVNWFEAAYFANRLSIVEGRTACYILSGCNAQVPGADMECSTVSISHTCTGYRLPTEAQWEYAARAGTIMAYANPVYFDLTDTETGWEFSENLDAMGWYAFNDVLWGDPLGQIGDPMPAYERGTKPVAAKQANRWGLYDMHGNVFEWCEDWYGEYPVNPVTDPAGAVSGSGRVSRGGCWHNVAEYARSANRDKDTPGERYHSLGFRLVLPPGQ